MKNILVSISFLFLAGCASIVNGVNEPLSMTTKADGADVTGAQCELHNDKGTWYVTTPGSTTVHRSVEDLIVKCKKKGYAPGLANVKSSTKGMAFGNILFGGVVGGAVDIGDGAAFDYPTLINVNMGKDIALNAKPSASSQQNIAKSGVAQTTQKTQQ